MSIVIANNISKNFKQISALKNISFEVQENEIFGFIGPDGSGKTTLFRILTTLMLSNSGTATVLGFDVKKDARKIRKKIGYMPGKFSLYPDLSVEENLNFFATIFGASIDKNYYLIKDIYSQIEPFKNRKAGKLSGGMKQKLALSCALIHKPKLLVLDEPTTGVDAVSRKEFWEMLKKLKQSGITIIVSTPYMDEASLCDRVALIQNGKILSINTPEKISENFNKDLLLIKTKDIYKLLLDLRTYPEMLSVYPFGQCIHYTDKDTANIEEINKFILEKEHTDIEITRVQAGIEDCFMLLMNNPKNNDSGK